MIEKDTSLGFILNVGTTCDKCGHCCSYSSGFLVEGDEKKIAEKLGITEKELEEKYLDESEHFNTKRLRPKTIKKKNKQYGECIFLKDKKCKIHDVKPLQCRVGNCTEHGEKLSKWFMLNYFVNSDDPESVRQYAIYLKTHDTLKGGELRDLIQDKERLKRILSFKELK